MLLVASISLLTGISTPHRFIGLSDLDRHVRDVVRQFNKEALLKDDAHYLGGRWVLKNDDRVAVTGRLEGLDQWITFLKEEPVIPLIYYRGDLAFVTTHPSSVSSPFTTTPIS